MGYPMNIGEAAQAAGLTAKMIRHYEGLGLIPEASRTDSGYRKYTARDITMLRFIRQSRSVGFSIKQIEQLLGLWADSNRESRDVRALAREHIAELDRRMAEMAQMKAALEAISAECQGDERADCPILSKLSGGAGGYRPASAPKAAPKRGRTAERAERPKPGRHDHEGLAAWMHGLQRAGTAAWA